MEWSGLEWVRVNEIQRSGADWTGGGAREMEVTRLEILTSRADSAELDTGHSS